MLAELFRIISHLVWYGTFAQDLGADVAGLLHVQRPRARFSTSSRPSAGARMHPSWFRIGGVAQDLPRGWDELVRDFVDYLPPRLNEYDRDGHAEPDLQGAHRRESALFTWTRPSTGA